ncbi:MAG TPA: hypothetical protein VFJ30_09500, partial [Phycisphaerae bacterium]|nr:hypothetical protein [Phycisphaerae bacterium]
MAISKDKRKTQTADDAGRNMKSGRRVAGINVVVAIVVATAVLIVANVIGSTLAVRRNVETLGRHRLSSRAQRILERTVRADRPVTVTSIYTSTAKDRHRDEYLPRVRDLLEEMDRHCDDLTAVNVTSDVQKAEVLNRLRDRLDAKAPKHRAAIAEFESLARRQLTFHKQLAIEWDRYPAAGWLTQFGVAKAFAGAFKSNREDLARADNEIRAAKAESRLPNYPEMASKIKTALEDVQARLEGTAEHLRKLKDLPGKADKAKGQLLKATEALTAATAKAAAATGKAGDPAPADPSAALEELAKALTGVANAGTDAAAAMNDFNTACDGYARFASSWRTGGTPLPQMAAQLAMAGSDLAEQVRSIRTAAKVEVQAQFLTEARAQLPQLMTGQSDAIAGAAGDLARELAAMDPTTEAVFAKAAEDGYMDHQIREIQKLLADLNDLEDLSGQSELIEQIGQENVVLVEVGEKVGVVGFEDVWPLAERDRFDMGMPEEKEAPRRAFNGDTAISSKVFSLGSEPLGEVVLTYFERIPPPQLRGQIPPVAGPIPSIYLETL